MPPLDAHSNRVFIASKKGAVAVEFALILPIILLIVWTFWQMSESYRLQWALNRQTADLADMLANQPEDIVFAGETESVTIPLEQQLPTLVTSANDLLKAALAKDVTGVRTGLVVEYAPGSLSEEGLPVTYTFSGGARCGGINGTMPLTTLLGDGGGQLTPPSTSSSSGIRVLRVQSCFLRKDPPAFLKLIAPKEIQSRYTAIRKEN